MDIIQWLGEQLENIASWVLWLLPDSPFQMLNNSVIAPYLGYINWILPLDFVVSTLSLWLVAVAGYYIYSMILRWIKAVD